MRIIALVCLAGLMSPAWADRPASSADRAAFRAAGFAWHNGAWHSDCGDPGTESYTGGSIEQLGDLNGDGRREVLITEGSSYCYGMTGTAFWLLSPTAKGGWQLMLSDTGVADVLASRGAGNWPDIAIGGPGFCFPVMRWNGRAYVQVRFEYAGKRCRRPA